MQGDRTAALLSVVVSLLIAQPASAQGGRDSQLARAEAHAALTQSIRNSNAVYLQGGVMNKWLRKARGVVGMGLLWGTVWAALMTAFGFGVMVVDPASIDPGEHPIVLGALMGLVGFVSGAGFGLLLSLTERKKSILNLSLGRAALWGMAGAAVIPLVTPTPNALLFILCPIGAACASASVAIARRAELRALDDGEAPTPLLADHTS